MGDDQIKKALALWRVKDCPYKLIAQRENRVYRVQRPDGSLLVLRIHRKNLRSNAEILSELQMMQVLNRKGQNVPTPVPLNTGELLFVSQDTQIDMLSWVEGTSLLDVPIGNRSDIFKRLGSVAAEFHNNIDRWNIPSDFSRPSWDRAGLIGDIPLWGAFWENSRLKKDEKDLILIAKANVEAKLKQVEGRLDYGLIHADMVKENVLIDGENIGLIDFDDSGFGFRVFELATIIQSQMSEPDFAEIRHCLIEGYLSKRALNVDVIDMFIMLRTWTYLGWIMSRMHEPGAQARCSKYIERSVRRSRQWLHGEVLS